MKQKLTSRKFWLATASVLASISTAIAGISTDNEVIVVVGLVCSVFSSCIYNIAESMVDANREIERKE